MLLTKETTGWSAHRLSLEISSIFSNINGALVINETWMAPNIIRVAKTWLKLDKSHTIIFISLFDPSKGYQGLFTGEEFARIHSINSKDICFWLLAVDRYFLNYSVEQVTPVEFKHNFLCYQRKITEPRTYLYNQLTNKSGIVTIGDKKFHDINSDIPYHTGLKEVFGNLEIANDIWSLGNIKIWNNSFLNIVSETEQSFESDHAFLSEKILKPIIGLRPFICFGHPDTTALLKSQGFETFDEEFGYRPTNNWKHNADQIATIVDKLDSGMFDSLKPKLIHNKNQLKNASQTEWLNVNKLYKIYQEKVKIPNESSTI